MHVDDALLNQVRQYAALNKLPAPTNEIGEGQEGVVYASTDPAVAVKITDSFGSYGLLDMQGPGVVEIYRAEEMDAKDDYGEHVLLLVTWMERLVETNEEIFRVIEASIDDQFEIEAALKLVNGRTLEELKDGVPILSKYKAFDELNALISSRTWTDMGLRNIGLNKRGQVVVFDV